MVTENKMLIETLWLQNISAYILQQNIQLKLFEKTAPPPPEKQLVCP